MNRKLEMTFDTNTIDHLGIKLYSTLPPVIAELISNAYDADATNIIVKLNDTISKEKTIEIIDDGQGMDFDEINDAFLVIGRNRRIESNERTINGRLVIGRKGLGKLSVFGIAGEIELTTIKNGYKNVISMIYADIKNTPRGEVYNPIIHQYNQLTEENSGTKIVLKAN